MTGQVLHFIVITGRQEGVVGILLGLFAAALVGRQLAHLPFEAGRVAGL
jgi:hypothetical protein